MRRIAIHVTRYYVWLDLVTLDLRSRRDAMNRIEHAKQLAGLVTITHGHECQHGPDGCVGILAAVFTNARHVSFDIARIPRHTVERWSQEENEPVPPVHKMLFDRRHGARSAARVFGAADYSPGLRNGIDAALRVCSGTEWRTVVKVRAAVPFSIPPVPFDRGLQCTYVEPPRFCTNMFAALGRHLGELTKHRM